MRGAAARGYDGFCPLGAVMVLTISLPTGITAKCAGIEVWMERAAERAKRVDSRWRVDDVHDLRVAIRRCRTMADALREVNPNAGWRRLKKSSRDLFHALGDLRDVQVERAWVKQLSEGGDPVRKRMLRPLARKERRYRGAEARVQGTVLSAGKRGVSEAGARQVERSAGTVSPRRESAYERSLAPAANRDQGISIRGREFSAAEI